MILGRNSRIPLSAIGVGLLLAGCSWMSRLPTGDRTGTATPPVSEHVRRGMALEEKGEFDRALAEYESALAADRGNPEILIDLGNVHAQLKQYPDAEKYYRDALERNPDSPMANNNLAWVLVLQGVKFPEAEGLIRKAMYADPGRVSVYLDTMTYLYLRQERYPDALNTLKAAENLVSPNDEALKAQLARTREIVTRAMNPPPDTEGDAAGGVPGPLPGPEENP
jgi:tetratricopeptide (TPR) repeat protein